ncbi:MAG: flagellar hook-length control protein FliK [Pseudomonadales bacterium]|nr:flagellar hook-length control protein FliK [Pseudomonadales bacterium]
MNGITPLLDTLLHGVLGKRVSAADGSTLNDPVHAVAGVQAPRSGHSDAQSAVRPQTAPESNFSSASRMEVAPGPAPGFPTAEPASVQASFSPSARLIASLLAQFSGPPSVIQAQHPLVLAPETDPAVLAGRLLASINDSGLFYESQLLRWYRGELPRQRLELQPQSLAAVKAGLMEARVDAPGKRAEGVLADRSGGLNEDLQLVLRQQLELLANPVLRWEGQLWPGFGMALMIAAPPPVMARQEAGDGNADEAGTEAPWHSELLLQTPSLGPLKVNLYLQGMRLNLALTTGSEAALTALEAGREGLLDRLRNRGFSAPGLHMQFRPAMLLDSSDQSPAAAPSRPVSQATGAG